jgi:hypothetical protein
VLVRAGVQRRRRQKPHFCSPPLDGSSKAPELSFLVGDLIPSIWSTSPERSSIRTRDSFLV